MVSICLYFSLFSSYFFIFFSVSRIFFPCIRTLEHSDRSKSHKNVWEFTSILVFIRSFYFVLFFWSVGIFCPLWQSDYLIFGLACILVLLKYDYYRSKSHLGACEFASIFGLCLSLIFLLFFHTVGIFFSLFPWGNGVMSDISET